MSRESKDSLLPKISYRNPQGDSASAASVTHLPDAFDNSARPEARSACGSPPKRTGFMRNPAAEEAERYLTVRDVGRRFAVSVQTVWRWAKERPQFPKPVELSPGTTRWRMSDLIAFERGLLGDVR